jgi:hypothetical protein
MFNFMKLCELILKGNFEIIKWCQENGLLLKEYKCNLCHNDMKLVYNESKDRFYWRSHSSFPQKHDNSVSVLKNSIFSKSNLPISSILILIYKFSINKALYENMIRECSFLNTTSTKTINKWLNKLREICMQWIGKYNENKGEIKIKIKTNLT